MAEKKKVKAKKVKTGRKIGRLEGIGIGLVTAIAILGTSTGLTQLFTFLGMMAIVLSWHLAERKL